MIQVQLTGATQVVTPARVLVGRDFGGTKPRQLLELLALEHGSPVSKDRLAELLWDGCPPASWTTTLEGYLSLLRGRLEPGVPARSSVIRTVAGGYLLDAERVSVDWSAVRVLAGQARAARAGVALPLLEQVLERSAGELLPESAGAAWAQTARQAHQVLRVDAATTAARHALHLGQPVLAATLADSALELDPMAEEACRCAMQGLWTAGRTGEALRRYTRLRTVLVQELGVDPAPETQDLFTRLLRDDVTAPVPLQRRRSDRPLAAAAPQRTVDVLAEAIVLALRRGPGARADDDDPELVAKMEDVLRRLQGASVVQRLALVS